MTQLCGRKVLCVPSLIHDAKNRGRRRRKGHVRMTIKTTRGTATARGPSPSPFCCACSSWKECIERGRKRPRWRGRPLYRSIPHSHSSFLRILQWAPMTLRCFPFATHGSTTKGRRICFDGLFSLIQLLMKRTLRCSLVKGIHKSLLAKTFSKNCVELHFNCCIRIVIGWCKCREPSWSMGGGSSSS